MIRAFTIFAVLAFATSASAEPVPLTDAQLDGITAGSAGPSVPYDSVVYTCQGGQTCSGGASASSGTPKPR